MRRPAFLFFLILWFVWPVRLGHAQTPAGTPSPTPVQVSILSPLPGQAIQGSITISGTTALEAFQSSELLFAYASDPTHTWFLIAGSNTPVSAGKLAEWDTTTLTDGNYTLQLVVTLKDGSLLTARAPEIRVRNYTAIETSTPTPPLPTATPKPGETRAPTATLTPTASPVPPTPTELPPNPVQLSPLDIGSGLFKGLMIVLAIFGLIGLYLMVRNLFQG